MQYVCVTIPQALGAYSFTTDGYGIFNVRTNCGCVPYTRRGGGEGGGQAQTSLDKIVIPQPPESVGSAALAAAACLFRGRQPKFPRNGIIQLRT